MDPHHIGFTFGVPNPHTTPSIAADDGRYAFNARINDEKQKKEAFDTENNFRKLYE